MTLDEVLQEIGRLYMDNRLQLKQIATLSAEVDRLDAELKAARAELEGKTND